MLVPWYYPNIVEMIRQADWLLHNFRAQDVDVYSAVDYQHNRLVNDITYNVILDMNFLQYLLNVVKRPRSTEHSRTAAAYLAFFQISDIQLDPTYAIYEKINYSNDRVDEAISNLEQFRGIDNHSFDELAAYALGYEQQLHLDPIPSESREELRVELLRYRRLTDWDSLYLCILAITEISIDASIPRPQKLLTFIKWCISEFRFSLAALVYAAALFGQTPARKMMKYKEKETLQNNMAALRNMTWDLYYVDRYMKNWASKEKNTESLMLTADSSLKLTMQLAVECQLAECLDPLRPHIGSTFVKVELAYAERQSVNRRYRSKDWGYDYRNNLIAQFESKLLRVET